MFRFVTAAAALTVAVSVASPAQPASAATPGAAVTHVVTSVSEFGAPANTAMPRGADLAVLNAPTNLLAHTYILVGGATTYSSGSVSPGATGIITVPATAGAGTYRLTRVGGGPILSSVLVI
jgi:hypothetical protein